MYTQVLLSALSGLALVAAQSPTSVSIPAMPTTTDGIPTIEGALVYDGPPVIGYTGPGGNATVQSNLPAATYMAVLPAMNFDSSAGGNIQGSITGMSMANGTGVMFSVNFTGFPSPALYGPFVYHIHQLPLDSTGNCTTAMAHLDPTLRGELHACEAAAPQTCQAGDLAGKHGNITVPTFMATYSDLYLSTDPSSPYFFGNRSIVIHSANATRLTCANFTMASMMMPSSTGAATPTPSMFMGAAGKSLAPASALMGLGAVILAALL